MEKIRIRDGNIRIRDEKISDPEWWKERVPALMVRSPARSSCVAALMHASYSSLAFSLFPLQQDAISMSD
jgi:hypothetical protein